MYILRREFLAGSAGLATAFALPGIVRAASDTVTIAYNVNLPSWDPTVGPSAVNPTIQGLYQCVFDQYIAQEPDLGFTGGIIEKWGYLNEDKTQIHLDVREGVTWHDGSPLTTADVIWSLERAGDPATGNPIQFIWGNAKSFATEGNRVIVDMERFDPSFFPWMAFLTAYVLPKDYYTSVGAEGFEQAPIGTGPYKVDKFERNSFLRLKANPSYWGGAPTFENVVFKFVTDASARVAEVESGASDVTLEIPYREFDRLKEKSGLSGTTTPVSDIAMIFLNDIGVMEDRNVRLAAHHAIDKEAIVNRLLSGYGVPIDTLQAPQYMAYDASIKVGHDPEKAKALLAESGYSTDNPVKFTIQTTRGFKPRDYEMIQAIVGMWRKVGIEAEIEVYEIAKHFELRAADKLAEAAFYNWGNSIGDPSTSTGFAMFGPSPHSTWDTDDLDEKIGPLWAEKDEEKRIAGWKAVDRYIAEQGYVIPLLQFVQPIVHSDTVTVVPHVSGALHPHRMAPA